MELKVIQEKIAELRGTESRSKTLISELAIAVVDRIHEHDEVTSANSFLLALSPLNQKKMLSFFRQHSGHKESEGVLAGRQKDFTDKNQQKRMPYKEAHDKFQAFKASGATFWQWCVMEKPKEEKPLDMGAVEKAAKKANEAMAQAIKLGLVSHHRAVELLLGGVMSQQDIMASLDMMIKADEAGAKAIAEAAEKAKTPA